MWCPVSYILDINRVPMSLLCLVSISELVFHRKVACYVTYVNNSVTDHYSDRASLSTNVLTQYVLFVGKSKFSFMQTT